MAGSYGRTIGRISIKVLPDASKFRDDIKKIVERAERQNKVKIPVEADTTQASRHLDMFYRQWERQTLEFRVNIEQRLANQQLQAIARNRSATIKVKVERKGLAAAEGFLKRISGFRVAVDLFRDVNDAILNLDKSVGTISRLSLSIASLTSSVISLAGGLITTSGDLLKIVNIGLLGPAAFAGFGVGVTALVIGLKTMSTELAELGPGFQRIKQIIQNNFWAEARQPILDLVNNVFPALRKGMGAVSGSIGRQMGQIATSLQSALGGGVLEQLFGTLVTTIDIVTEAMDPLVRAFVKMGEVGSTFLPGIARAFVDVSNKFNDWVQATAASGEMFRFIQEGLDNLVLAARAIGAVAGIFRALDAAATNAGAGGLATFTGALEGARAILASPEVQNGLTTLFSGAQVAVSAVGAGIKDIGAALINMAPTFAGVFATAGATIGGLFSSIASAMQRPEFQSGLTNLFSGIQEGVEGIKPAIPAIADILGKLGTLVGALAASFGPLVGTIKTTFAPALESIIDVVTRMVPIISGALTGAISGLSGPVSLLGGLIGGNADGFAKLGVGLVAVVAAVRLGMIAFKAYQLVMVGVRGVMAAYQAFSYGAAGATYAVTTAQKIGAIAAKAFAVATKIAGVAMKAFSLILRLSPIGLVITAIGLLVAGFIYAYNNIKPFRDFIDGLGRFFAELATNIGAGLVTAWNAVGKWFGDVLNGFKGWVDSILAFFGIHSPSTLFRDIALNLIAGLVQGFQGLMGALSAAWSGVAGFFTGLFTTVQNAVVAGVGAVAAFFSTAWDGIKAIWDGFWNGLGAVVSTVWAGIVLGIQLYVTAIQTVIGAVISFVTTAWSAFWNGLKTVATTVFAAIVLGVTLYVTAVQTVIGAVIGFVKTAWSAFWNGLKSVASTVFGAIVGFVKTYATNVQTGITTAINVVKSVWSAGWNAVKSTVSSVFGAVVGVVSGVVNSVRGSIQSGISTARGIWQAGWSGISSAVSGAVGAIRGVVSGMVSAVTGAVSNVGSAFSGIKGRITSALSGAGSWLLSAGKAIVQGLISGITSMIGAAGSAIGGVMGKISSFLPHSPAKEGPFSGKGWTPYSGRALVEGLAQGMEDRTDKVRKAALAMVQAASPDVPGIDIGEDSTGLLEARSRQAQQLQLLAMGTNVTVQGDVGYDPQAIADEIDIRKRQAQMSVDFDSLIAP